MFKRILVFSTTLPLLLSGCATPQKSIFLGSGIGVGFGAGVGAMVNSNQSSEQRATGAFVGALIGAVAGGFIGNEGYKDQKKKDLAKGYDPTTARLDMFGAAASSPGKPTLKPAQVRVRYVEDQVKDGTFTPAHFEYDISEGAHWEGAK